MPGTVKKKRDQSGNVSKKKTAASQKASGTAVQSSAAVKPVTGKKVQRSVSPDKSLKNLAVYVKRLEKENSILAKELIQKKERRLQLPIINPEENRMAMARLNMRITETESLMALQKKGLTAVKEIISTQENRMKEITNRIADLQNDVSKKVIKPDEAKIQLEGLLSELQKLRSRREQTMADLAV